MSTGVNLANDLAWPDIAPPSVGLIATGPGPWVSKRSPSCSIQATVAGTGAVTATINVEVSNGPDGAPQALATIAGTITLNGTTSVTDGFTTQNAPWRFIRFNVTALTGTGAKVTGILGT